MARRSVTAPGRRAGRGRSLTFVLFVLFTLTVLVAVGASALLNARTIDRELRRAAERALCTELTGLVDHWAFPPDTAAYIAEQKAHPVRDKGVFTIAFDAGSNEPPPPAQTVESRLSCADAFAAAHSLGLPAPILFEAHSAGQDRIAARMADVVLNQGPRWAQISIDVGATLKPVIRTQIVFSLAALLVAMAAGAVAAVVIGRRLQRSVRAVNEALTAYAGGATAARADDDPHDTIELAELKARANAALGEIAGQAEARERAARQIVHDIRSPLGKVEMWLRPRAPDDPKIARALATVREVIAGTRLILAGLGGTPPAHAPFALSRMLEDYAVDFAANAPRRGIALTATVDPDVVVTGDQAAIDRMLGNLFQNILDHGAPGGAYLTLDRRGGGFTMTLENALGEPAEYSSSPSNFGIGHASVRAIVAEHGWRFEAGPIDDHYRVTLAGKLAQNL